MYGSLDISTSGLIAQRTRLEAITANIANQHTISDAQGRNIPYARRAVFFAPGDTTSRSPEARSLGVHVASISKERSYTPRWDPNCPLANAEGYVNYPDINPVYEMMNMYDAQRAYEANLAAAEGTKTIMAQSLRLLA